MKIGHAKGWLLAAAILPAACAGEDSGAADVAAIDAAYTDWVAATNARDLERWARHLASDPLFMPPDRAALAGRAAILAFYEELFADPQFAADCEQRAVEVSPARDTAWSHGRCRITFTGPDGAPAEAHSKWAKVWAKGPDGRWQGRLNIWNALPAGDRDGGP